MSVAIKLSRRLLAARRLLNEEADALRKLSDDLNDAFEAAVEAILTIPPVGRVIVSGIGKAGFIARKLSSTFSSVGIPSSFLHPAEAAHGELGRVTKHDVIILLSNSGHTAEILQIIPMLKKLGSTLIAVTGDAKSTLALRSDIVLCIGAVKEAGPLGLAPTTSATLMLAIGDALVMTALEERAFTREQFAMHHPAGMLGRSLMLVSEIMRTGELHCVARENASAKEVLHLISSTKGRPGAASIVNQEGKLVGIFTDGDFRRCLEQGAGFLDQPISTVMGKAPKTIQASDLVQNALELIRTHKIDQVIVVDAEQNPIGLVDIQDVVDV